MEKFKKTLKTHFYILKIKKMLLNMIKNVTLFLLAFDVGFIN